MSTINLEMLRTIPLFELLDDDEASALSEQLEQKTFWEGQMVFQQGDAGGTMYVIQSGKVELFIKDKGGDRVTLGILHGGEIFGEFSLLDNDPRSASAKALEETHVFVVDRHDLEMLFKSHEGAAFDLLAMLSRRIRETDVLVGERVIARNVNEEIGGAKNFGDRLSDFLTTLAGDIRFVYFNFLWFGSWIVLNTSIIPGLEPFDPFPFGLLTMIVSLEAIFLSLFVLISQNRQAARDKVRNDIEYEVNIKAELEIRGLHDKVEELQELMLQHLQRMDNRVGQLQTGANTVVNNNKQRSDK